MTRKSRSLRDARCSRGTRWLSLVLALSLVVASVPNGLAYSVDQSGPASGVEAVEPTPADLQQLVAPIAIEPSDPEIIYVPQYNPWLIYGAPVVAWPGWYPYPGLFIADPGIGFGVGFGIGLFAGFGWGWGHWGCDWGHRAVVYNHNTYVSRGRTFVNRRTFDRDRAGFAHGGTGFAHGGDGFAHGGDAHRLGSFHGPGAARGGDQHAFMAPREAPNGRWGAFSGFDHGGATRGFSQHGP